MGCPWRFLGRVCYKEGVTRGRPRRRIDRRGQRDDKREGKRALTDRATNDTTDETSAAFARAADHAALVAALHTLVAATTQASAARRIAPALAPRAIEQLSKALRAAEVTPTDPTTLLVHLTAARSFLVEGGGPPPLARALSAGIARVHHLARTAPDVFRPAGSAPVTTVPTVTGLLAQRFLP